MVMEQPVKHDGRHPARPRLRIVNAFTRWILRTPALRRVADHQVIELRYAGTSSGRQVALPVMYAQRGEVLVVLVGGSETKRWWRNFTRPQPVEVLLRGASRSGTARLVPLGDDDRHQAAGIYAEQYPDISGENDPFIMIRLDPLS